MVITMLIASCNEVSEKEPQVVNSYDFVGQLHNRGLDYVFKKVTRGGNIELTENEFEELCMEYVQQVLQEEEILDISDYYQTNIEQEMHDAFEAAIDWAEANLNEDELEEDNLSELIDSLDVDSSVKNEIQEIISNIQLLPASFLSTYMSNKENEICMSADYDDVEKAMILSIVSIGKYSSDYWEDTIISSGLSSRHIVKADAVGAVRGIWRGRLVIGFCSMVGGPASGGAAALRYALLEGFIASAAYAFIESNIGNGNNSTFPEVPDDGLPLIIP